MGHPVYGVLISRDDFSSVEHSTYKDQLSVHRPTDLRSVPGRRLWWYSRVRTPCSCPWRSPGFCRSESYRRCSASLCRTLAQTSACSPSQSHPFGIQYTGYIKVLSQLVLLCFSCFHPSNPSKHFYRRIERCATFLRLWDIFPTLFLVGHS